MNRVIDEQDKGESISEKERRKICDWVREVGVVVIYDKETQISRIVSTESKKGDD